MNEKRLYETAYKYKMSMRNFINMAVKLSENWNKQKMRPTAEDLAAIRKIRHQVRCEERNGGQCGFVCEIVEDQYGWPMAGGTYCNDADEPTCDGHYWCVLPDGAIFDPTADQLGFGFDMRIVEPNDPDFRKYRREWTDEYNPGMSDDYPELKDVKWSGREDFDWNTELRAQRGDHWHVTHPEQHAAYLKKAAAYRAGLGDPDQSEEDML